jgi:hypothetical protein
MLDDFAGMSAVISRWPNEKTNRSDEKTSVQHDLTGMVKG